MDSFITRDIGSNFRGVPLFIFTISILQYVAYTYLLTYISYYYLDLRLPDR